MKRSEIRDFLEPPDPHRLTWPNGYDRDPIALHDQMEADGLLERADDAAE